VTSYDDRPWLAHYARRVPHCTTPEFPDALSMFRAALERVPETTAVSYFDGRLTLRELDAMSDALAAALLADGFGRGDRLAVYLQKVPQFLVSMLAAWKAGGIMVWVNPMSRERELLHLLNDSGSVVLVCLEELYDCVARTVLPDTGARLVVTTSALEHQTRDDPRLFAGMTRTRHPGTSDLAELIDQFAGSRPPPVELSGTDTALLTYTSGTTGAPKAAMNTHGNVSSNAQALRAWVGLTTDDVVLGVAPLFHLTGLIAHIAVALVVPMELVLTYRFDPGVVVEALRERRPTFTVAALPVYIALAETPWVEPQDLASLRTAYSGGAPVPPAWAHRFRDQFGVSIHSMYGLTETTCPRTRCRSASRPRSTRKVAPSPWAYRSRARWCAS